jgi:hypothetical protein
MHALVCWVELSPSGSGQFTILPMYLANIQLGTNKGGLVTGTAVSVVINQCWSAGGVTRLLVRYGMLGTQLR